MATALFCTAALATAGAGWWTFQHPGAWPPALKPQQTPATVWAQPADSPVELAISPDPPAPTFVVEHGVRLEDEPHVRDLLGRGVRCRYWTGADSDQVATVFDLLRLRHIGYASLPFDYEVLHEQEGRYDYVIIREHVKQRDGSAVRGMPGFVQHRYLYDEARDRFELLDSTPEDIPFDSYLLRGLGDPMGFLALHWDAVCNGRLMFPELRAQRAAATEADHGPHAADAKQVIAHDPDVDARPATAPAPPSSPAPAIAPAAADPN